MSPGSRRFGMTGRLWRAGRWIRDVAVDGYAVTQAARLRAQRAEAHDIRAYREWIATCEAGQSPPGQADLDDMRLISIVMPVYAPPLELLDAAIGSVRSQTYPHWELCLAEDASPDEQVCARIRHWMAIDNRIRCVFRASNGGIAVASNSALELVRSDYFILMDHDDVLAADALECVAEELQRCPDTDILYSDEDKLDATGRRCDPHFKPDWDPVLLLAQNYMAHLICYRTELVRQVGAFRTGFDGSQDHELLLRCSERSDASRVRHIPRILYHWRIWQGSTALSAMAKPNAVSSGVRAVGEHLQRRSIHARVEADPNGQYQVDLALPAPLPVVSIVAAWRFPTRFRHLARLLQKSGWPAARLELILVSRERPGLTLKAGDVRYVESAENLMTAGLQRGAALASGELITFITDTVHDASEQWLARLVAAAVQPGVGLVGAKGVSRRNVILEGGYVGDQKNPWCDPRQFLSDGSTRLLHHCHVSRICSAVSWHGLTLRRNVLQECLPLWRADCPERFSAIDFCWRVRSQRLSIVWTPAARLVLDARRWRQDAARDLQTLMPAIHHLWPQPPDDHRFLNPVFDVCRNDFTLESASRRPAVDP